MPNGIRYVALALALAVMALPVAAVGTGQFKHLLDKVKQSTHASSSSALGSNLPGSDIAAGLKEALTARIHPIVARATDSVGVTQQYKSFTSGSSGGSLGSALGSLGALGGGKSNKGGSPLDLDDYVTAKTLDGLFTTIGEQEQSIRHNPGARSTELLKRVFGGH